jgi:hypothetical protein
MTMSAKSVAEQARQQRLSRALRENLKRRKAQARGRAQDPQPVAAETPDAWEAGSEESDTRLSPQSRSD